MNKILEKMGGEDKYENLFVISNEFIFDDDDSENLT